MKHFSKEIYIFKGQVKIAKKWQNSVIYGQKNVRESLIQSFQHENHEEFMVSLKNNFLFFSKLYSESGFGHFSIFFRFTQTLFFTLKIMSHRIRSCLFRDIENHFRRFDFEYSSPDDSLTFREDKWWFHNFTGVSGEIDWRASMDDHRTHPNDCHSNLHHWWLIKFVNVVILI